MFLCITYLQEIYHAQANMKYYKNDGDKPKSPHFFSAKKISTQKIHIRGNKYVFMYAHTHTYIYIYIYIYYIHIYVCIYLYLKIHLLFIFT